jgi:hypothetical protein
MPQLALNPDFAVDFVMRGSNITEGYDRRSKDRCLLMKFLFFLNGMSASASLKRADFLGELKIGHTIKTIKTAMAKT